VAGCAEVSAGVFHAFVYSNGAMRDLDPGGAAGSCANAVNDSGVAAGRSSSGEAVIWTPGGVVDLGVKGSVQGINNAGVAVGGYSVGTSTHAFIFASGALTDISMGNAFSTAYAINQRNQAVVAAGGRSFVYDAGAIRDIGSLMGGGDATARSINDLGEVVGMAGAGPGQPVAFVYDGVMRVLPGPSFAGALAINSRGQVVASGEGIHGYLIDGGTFTRMDTLNVVSDRHWHGLEPTGINDRGWIVGQGFNENNEPRAFLLVPTDPAEATAAVNPLSRGAQHLRRIS
jgi:probable HAF family extracellular repeat protein